MELYDLVNPVEEAIAEKAGKAFLPLGGTMELLPLCNMDCKMCYIRQTKAQMDAQGRMLTCDEWLKIAEQAKAAGVLYILLTGGEPLIYPEFKRLYTALHHMGFVLTINTNATLIDEQWADFFGKMPCRRLNITLYGKDDETYGALCGNPKGFTQVSRAAVLLKERNVPFRFTCSVTPYNVHQIEEIGAFARSFGVPFEPCSYMFPPGRKGETGGNAARLSPEEAGASVVSSYRVKYPDHSMRDAAQNTLELAKKPVDRSKRLGLKCRAGRSGFWITWKGEMMPCGMFTEPKISLLEHPFMDCWAYTVINTLRIGRCADCESCTQKEICKTCAAACLTETGSFGGKPEYLCRMTNEMLRLCEQIVGEE